MEQSFLTQPQIKATLQEMAVVAGYLWERGWAERNAGNMSVNISKLASWRVGELVSGQMDRRTGGQEKQVLLVSASGCRMRELTANPGKHVCIIGLDDNGETAVFTKEAHGLKPTSELPTHLAIQQMLIRKNAPEKAVLHTHVTELIALTQLERFRSEEAINNMLWGMHPETMLFIPEGVGFIPYTLPGTQHIAELTRKCFESHKVVIWEKHGCMAIGPSITEAFDIIDILAKSARIWFSCKAAGFEPGGLSEEQLREIRESGA